MRKSLVVSALLLLSGCPSASDGCECASSEFCCVGTCLPLGSRCPPVPDGMRDVGATADAFVDPPVDAAAVVNCGPRPIPGGGSAGSASRCMGTAGWYCTGAPTACNAGYHCVEWLDTGVNQFRAGCIDTHQVPCLPDDGNTCSDATTLLQCDASLQNPMFSPPGLGVPVDCVARYGADSICMTDETGAHCTTTACDPSTFVATCMAEDRFSTCAAGTVGGQVCASSRTCLANDLTAPSATCIPRGAATSATRSAERTVLGCTGTALFIAQYGYEWGETCGSGQVCRGAGSSARCVAADAVPCDPATFVSSCADAIREMRCGSDGHTALAYCGLGFLSGSIPSACDATTGRCVPRGFCSPGPTFDDSHCDPTGRFALRCNEEWLTTIAEPCAGCEVDASGALLCH